MIRRLICRLRGHDWEHQPDAIPEDRGSDLCVNCDDGLRADGGERDV